MVKRLEIHKYKKLADINIDFTPGVNAISGTNGTCKTTLLHIASNAFQAVTQKDPRLEDASALKRVNQLNAQVNTKMEKLAKGDREYNDPAPHYKGGSLFEVVYYDGTVLSFRKHNSAEANRYAIKPFYKKGSNDRLPSIPVVYLSLARLLPWGEYQDESSVRTTSTKADSGFYDELSTLYRSITGIRASSFSSQAIGSVKKRQEFDTPDDGIDSNTVSSGEDNVAILLTALLSLKKYYEALSEDAKQSEVCSLLLIDEFDATLHPSFQYLLLDTMRSYSAEYHIQILFTTHSITLLNRMFKQKLNVIYLKNNGNVVKLMEEPDPTKIEMYLRGITRADFLADKIIPVFSEDNEARLLFNLLLNNLVVRCHAFFDVQRRIHLVESRIGAEQLEGLFNDRMLRQSSIASICVLDGDHSTKLDNNIIALPGGVSPEWVAFNYAQLISTDGSNPFWNDSQIESEGFSHEWYMSEISRKIDEFDASNSSERDKVKRFFNKNIIFFRYILKAWILDEANEAEVSKFAESLSKVYRKAASYHGIDIPRNTNFQLDSESFRCIDGIQ